MFSFFNLTGIKHISFGDNVSTWAVIQMVTDIFYIGKLAITDFFKATYEPYKLFKTAISCNVIIACFGTLE